MAAVKVVLMVVVKVGQMDNYLVAERVAGLVDKKVVMMEDRQVDQTVALMAAHLVELLE